VVAEPENWRRALDEFDDLVGEGHDDLELYPSTEREDWNFYIDGVGDDSDAAWAYCDRFGLGTDDCFAARIRGDDAGDVEAQPATQDSEAGTDP
jgi:hypothetical protein